MRRTYDRCMASLHRVIVSPVVRPVSQTHRQRLASCLSNDKIPDVEKNIIRDTIIPACDAWSAATNEEPVALGRSVAALNEYKAILDTSIAETEYMSRNDGQLKVSGGLLEDFFVSILRRSVDIPGITVARQLSCATGLYFSARGDPVVKTKVHDVVIARQANATFEVSSATTSTGMYLANVAIEIKTSLDKTMFQEACATAADLRRFLPDARYFLVCEWLDMAPIPTASTAISRAYILRGRRKRGSVGKDRSFLVDNPIRERVVAKIIEDATSALSPTPTDDATRQGFF